MNKYSNIFSILNSNTVDMGGHNPHKPDSLGLSVIFKIAEGFWDQNMWEPLLRLSASWNFLPN